MRCRTFLRWAAVCAALLIVAAPGAAVAQDEHGHEHGEMGEGHGHGEMTPEQQAEMEAWMAAGKPGPEHARLAAGEGRYDVTARMWEAPGAEPMVSEGTAERTMTLGGRVLEESYSGSMMGMPFEGVGRTGYDNVKKTYWATWTDSMSTSLMLMHGTMGDDGSASFEGDMTSPVDGSNIHMRIATRVEGGKEIHDFYIPGPGGEEFKHMELVYEKAD